jgi:hypothetical protein
MSFWLQGLLCFLMAAGLDAIWVYYMAASRNKKALRAAMWSAAMFLPAGFNVISYVGNHWFLAFSAAGAAAGTFVSLKLPHE